MEYLLFLLNILLTTAYAASFACAYFLYKTRGGRVFLALTMLFFIYFLDNTVVFMTEVFPQFGEFYDSIFAASPVFKAVLHIGMVFCYLFIHKQILREKFNSIEYVLLIIYAMTLFTVQLIPNKAVSSWAYYLPTQLFVGGLAVYGLLRMRKYPRRYQRSFYKFYRSLCVFVVIINLMIALEDTYVIFNVDIYTTPVPIVFNRNFSENLMMLVFSIALIRFTRLVLIHRDVSVFGPVVVPPKNVISTMDAFCHLSSLTDRERDVLVELLNGLSIAEISEKLYISSGTVKTHIHNLYQKVDVSRKTELIRKYNSFEAELQSGEN